MDRKSILVVDDDRIILDSLCEFLSLDGFEAIGAESQKAALEELCERPFNLVITDVNLPDGSGLQLLESIGAKHPQVVVIVITGYGTIESAVTAIKHGAYDYLTKPIIDDDLRLAIERALKQQSLVDQNEQLRQQLERKNSLESIISQNYKMSRIFDLVDAVGDTRTTILMTGPSGTGKSMLAKAIHHRSSRREQPFIEVSCGAIPETLLESELFGHVRGAFTGAVNNKDGKFLAADKGTIFLDEISNASPALQAKLLRVLEDRQFEAVGSNRTIAVDTRIILASNRNLEDEVQKGRFREDLYYRINVVTVELPSLCERVGDVRLLAEHFLHMYSALHKKERLGFSDAAMNCMERYIWPGNVRELENVVERAALLSKGRLIELEDLPESVRKGRSESPGGVKPTSLKDALADHEAHLIRQALERNNWNRQKTAAQLGINRTTLFKKMRHYGLYAEAERLGLV